VLAGKSENALEYKEMFVRDIKVLKDTYSKGNQGTGAKTDTKKKCDKKTK
jgi:hypothetical protein